MNTSIIISKLILFIGIFAATSLLTEIIRRYNITRDVLDEPIKRSLHTVATPTGGGLSVVVIFLSVIGANHALFSMNFIYAVFGSSILVAMVGYWDDYKYIATKWRFIAHIVAIIWVLFFFNDGREFIFIGFILNKSLIGIGIILFLLVWQINLFNFMDGIDGLHASETIFVASTISCFSYLYGFEHLSFASLVLAISMLGFLMLNWSPAKIFMGDVSSGFVGLVLGIIAYDYILSGGLAWTWVILMGVFLIDSSLTLFIRIYRKQPIYVAHNDFAFHHAAKKWGHKTVTITVILINLIWLLPLASLSQSNHEIAPWLTLVALIPLVILAIKYKAGITF